MTSANDITITAATPPVPDTLPDDASDEVINVIFRDIRVLMDACGDNKNDKVDVLITALIDRGINTGPRLVGVAKHIGFNGKHAGRRLRDGIGHRWSRDADGTYRNLM